MCHSWLYFFGHMAKSTEEKSVLFLLLSLPILVGVKSLNILFGIALLVLDFSDMSLFLILKEYVVVFFIFMFELD